MPYKGDCHSYHCTGSDRMWAIIFHPSKPPGICIKVSSENVPMHSLLGERSSADCENHHQLLHSFPHLHCHSLPQCRLHLRSPHFPPRPEEEKFICDTTILQALLDSWCMTVQKYKLKPLLTALPCFQPSDSSQGTSGNNTRASPELQAEHSTDFSVTLNEYQKEASKEHVK